MKSLTLIENFSLALWQRGFSRRRSGLSFHTLDYHSFIQSHVSSHQKSTCLTLLTLLLYVVQIWSRDPRNSTRPSRFGSAVPADSAEDYPSTRWTTTLSSKIDLPHVINFIAKFGHVTPEISRQPGSSRRR